MLVVPRKWFLGMAAALWVIPAIILLGRALAWSDNLASGDLVLAAVGVCAGSVLCYTLWFRKIVVLNILRISVLAERAPVWRVSSARGYAMILLMVSAGILLRSSDVPRIYLAGPYAFMGGCLLLGSIEMGLKFLAEISMTNDPP